MVHKVVGLSGSPCAVAVATVCLTSSLGGCLFNLPRIGRSKSGYRDVYEYKFPQNNVLKNMICDTLDYEMCASWTTRASVDPSRFVAAALYRIALNYIY